jgi:mono/diheme cytochrome c family protein
MFYSTAYETYSVNPVFSDRKTMRKPVEGTVSREDIPFEYKNDPADRILAGKELVNPIVPSAEVLERGKIIYQIYCLNCHGNTGLGDGQLYTSKLYPLKPRSLVAETARNLKDGEIFHSITLGFGSMGAHGSQIRTEDRWKVIYYIRELQRNTHLEDDAKRK